MFQNMCRFLVYKGKDEILLSKLILEPAHSILTQSYDSRLRVVSCTASIRGLPELTLDRITGDPTMETDSASATIRRQLSDQNPASLPRRYRLGIA